MKKSEINRQNLHTFLRVILFFLIFSVHAQFAKSSPLLPTSREIAARRAKTLDNGISVSWLEQTWDNNVLNATGIKGGDFELLKKLGFKVIRLPVAFEYFAQGHGNPDTILARIDQVLRLCRSYQFKLVLDYHYGAITDATHAEATNKAVKTWLFIANKYKGKFEDDLFFELYNEPPPMDPGLWHDAAYNLITSIRTADQQRTLLVGASNYNSIYELSRSVRFKDENIIYTFHFYEPFLFTHQGAGWVGDQMATTGVPFPYSVEKFPVIGDKAKNTWGEQNYNKYHLDGNEGSIKDKLKIARDWADKYGVPVVCTEYGSYSQYADPESRCQYLKAMRADLKLWRIPGIMWEYNANFSIFNGNPSLENLSDCMKQALGYTQN